jgi:hypothetical protein
MGRNTKPLRVSRDTAEQIQSLAEEHDTRPAKVLDEIMANTDLETTTAQAPEPDKVGACPVTGYVFDESEVQEPIFGEPWVEHPDPDDELGSNHMTFLVSELDDVE